MRDGKRSLVVQAAPFLARGRTTPALMVEVILALVPVLGAAVWVFGSCALAVVGAAVLGAVGVEAAISRRCLRDGSAVLTGMLLGLTLPPAIPLWMAALGGAVAVGLGKAVFGGLGQNLFNPALVGRAFLQAAFPTTLTTWVEPGARWDLHPSNLAWPLMHGAIDGVSAATPLARMKFAHQATPLADLLQGDVAGSLGETSAILLAACGVWLALRRVFDWRIPLAMLVSVGACAAALFVVAPDRYPPPWHMLASGGLLFGAVFMATDPVTSPTAPLAAWIFGAGAGALVVLIRVFGGLPEGVMYAILLMNAATPLLERIAQPRPFGRDRRAAA